MKRMILTVVVLVFIGSAAQAATTIQDSTRQKDYTGYTQGGSGIRFTKNAWDFSGQDYMALDSIDTISIELSLYDLDTRQTSGWDDFDQITLALDGIDTGLKLNGFPNSRSYYTLNVTGTNLSDQVLGALKADGKLEGYIMDASPGENYFKSSDSHRTELTLTGRDGSGGNPATVPTPGALLLGGLGTVIANALKRRRMV